MGSAHPKMKLKAKQVSSAHPKMKLEVKHVCSAHPKMKLMYARLHYVEEQWATATVVIPKALGIQTQALGLFDHRDVCKLFFLFV